jgi:hypothetical protein
MRRVYINGSPPQDWIDDAQVVTNQLRAATSDTERQEIIKKNEPLWRDDRIRIWLLNQFKDKCWYTEARDSVSSIHVDHYRPKGRVSSLKGVEGEGYWWLAFDWKNYRICGQLINIKKSDLFPITGVTRASSDNPDSLYFEAPVIIDPLKDESRLVSYEKDEDACIAVPANGIIDSERHRAEKTIEVIGLNRLSRLNQKRATFWDDCLLAIAEYKGAEGPLALRLVCQAGALNQLKRKVTYDAEFSSVSEACIRKNAPEPLIAAVFEQLPSNSGSIASSSHPKS